MLKFHPPTDPKKLDQQIQVLQWQIDQDKKNKNFKDLEIHTEALRQLQLKKLNY